MTDIIVQKNVNQGKPGNLCYGWERNGECKRGGGCPFSHPDAYKGTKKMKGTCVPLVGDTPRIGATGQVGSEESLGKCQEASLEYDIKGSSSNGPHPRM